MAADLSVNVGGFLPLEHPLWISSAHYSSKASAIKAWQDLHPAAVTLKTSHHAPQKENKKVLRKLTDKILPRFGRSLYCDGPKHVELLDYDATAALLSEAKAKLDKTKVGISCIPDKDEQYADLVKKCVGVDFCELNLKYSFRLPKGEEKDFLSDAQRRFSELLKEIQRFLDETKPLPAFIKIPRELSWLPGTREAEALLEALKKRGKCGIIVANSLKMNIGPVVAQGEELDLSGGVICGERLYDETIDLIQRMSPQCKRFGIPIVATGGMVTPEQTLMAIRAGAEAVQLCTAFDYYGLSYYQTLVWNYQNRVEARGLSKFTTFAERLRDEGIASIYNMPFMYLEQFYSDDTQRRMLNDVKQSSKMTLFLMSGRTLVEKWGPAFRDRFGKNLGGDILLPNVDGELFPALQKAWGIGLEAEIAGRKARVRQTATILDEIWKQSSEDRKAKVTSDDPEAEFHVRFSEQCPFYSFYLFDDKVYVAPYPFTRPDDFQSPALVFFAGSSEYDRIDREAKKLVTFAKQTTA